MADKATKPATEIKPMQRTYTLPEYGVSVLATSVEEAVAKAKKSKESK